MKQTQLSILPLLVAPYLLIVAMAATAQTSNQLNTIDTSTFKQAHLLALEGLQHDLAGRYQQAVAAYRQALEYAPDDASLYNNLGCAYAMLQHYDQATVAFRKAITLDPKYEKAFYNLGQVDDKTNRPQAAVAAYQKSAGAQSAISQLPHPVVRTSTCSGT